MLHQLAGATIQVANLINYNCHLLEDGNHLRPIFNSRRQCLPRGSELFPLEAVPCSMVNTI